ncbi:hypothetical protein [Streptomyces sp. RKAG337]|uniref:hypothetical protein n=1 Tax=Streptomyces sp. RKAG337 TaxID=2893404 RepID=UPI002033CDCF|nr:hypothetical protein [Streptomyces sp. RKAG337]MCM2424960.1 hypothetical protein [Streptomyces sp. RKAG337]
MNMRKKLAAQVAATTLLAGLVTVGMGATSAQASGSTVHGCASGNVCIYPQDAGWNNDQPSYQFASRGAHNLSGQEGYHYVFNNQTEGWTAHLMTGYNGTGTNALTISQDWAANWNLSPINSITLQP